MALGLGLALVPSAAQAEELTKYTGYTRPGDPTGPAGAIKDAAPMADGTPIGATVYFKVFELSEGSPTDPWGTGLKNLEHSFVSGQASRGRGSQKLDTTARYLYVYQVNNDSYRDGQVKSVAIRLLVPTHLITSWGHFAEKADKKGAAGKGVGFAMPFENPDPKKPNVKSMVLPLSTEHPGVVDALYRNPAPFFNAPQTYSLSNIQLGNKPAPLTDGEDTGREPERVVLQTMANFEGAPNWLFKDGVALPGMSPLGGPAMPFANLAAPVGPMGPMGPGMGAVSPTEALRRAPAVVAYWTDEPLLPGVAGMRPGQRSTLFGFTSNYPPAYEDVRVRGNQAQVNAGGAAAASRQGGSVFHFTSYSAQAPAAAPDARTSNLVVDGQVPTPVGFEQCLPLAPALGSLSGPVGGIGAGGGLLRGGGGFGGGGFGFGFGGGFGGGGMGGGMMGGGGGSGSGSGTGTGTGNANNNVTPFPFSLVVMPQLSNQNAVAVNVQQAQEQIQQQQQNQHQHQHQHNHHHHHGHVVPEPAAVVPALLGVPVLLWLVWRRRTVLAPAIS
jgi:hypothetical protein